VIALNLIGPTDPLKLLANPASAPKIGGFFRGSRSFVSKGKVGTDVSIPSSLESDPRI